MNQHNNWLERIGRSGLKTVKFDTGSGGGAPSVQAIEATGFGLAGLSKEATAWAMFAYSNTEDEKSLNYLASRLSKIVLRSNPKIPTRSIVGLVKITLRECLMYAPDETTRKGCTVAAKSIAMGIARKTYYAHRESIESSCEMIRRIVSMWEEQIRSNGHRLG
ncbi:hypothetical protein [Vibrio ziniensis]|uniref:Uncharacterized protein n=1 Tax=Vibrio ziniensis TaxID=2711221 RepID=A0A6G7CMV5_9VIBR|nr:hypothetical protein [Vibrio ziniensis]QIH43467.1 hypothetical protein G5S32_15835 [Vibrio ziniensis]